MLIEYTPSLITVFNDKQISVLEKSVTSFFINSKFEITFRNVSRSYCTLSIVLPDTKKFMAGVQITKIDHFNGWSLQWLIILMINHYDDPLFWWFLIRMIDHFSDGSFRWSINSMITDQSIWKSVILTIDHFNNRTFRQLFISMIVPYLTEAYWSEAWMFSRKKMELKSNPHLIEQFVTVPCHVSKNEYCPPAHSNLSWRGSI